MKMILFISLYFATLSAFAGPGNGTGSLGPIGDGTRIMDITIMPIRDFTMPSMPTNPFENLFTSPVVTYLNTKGGLKIERIPVVVIRNAHIDNGDILSNAEFIDQYLGEEDELFLDESNSEIVGFELVDGKKIKL
jgi:hypothetical protein